MSAGRHLYRQTALRVFLLPTLLLATVPASAASTTTTTTLAITSSTGSVTSISAGTAATLTATVTAGAAAVPAGQVNFCDATAAHCTDIHRVGFAFLTKSGTAAFTFVPGPGVHSYTAEYAGTSGVTGSSNTTTTAYEASSSAASSLTVGSVPTTTTITQSGSAGDYTLKAIVGGTGSVTGPTGTVSFLDTSDQNAVLGSATLGTATPAFTWITKSPATAVQPNSIAVADFNGDGISDIAIATNGTAGTSGIGQIQILLGNGDGTFQAAKTYTGLSGNQLIVAAPFVSGGPEDLLVVNNATDSNNSGTVANGLLFTGDGKGNFKAGTPFQTGVDSISAIFAGDFNGDGIQDYALGGTLFGIDVLGVTFGSGTGTFGLATINATQSLPITIAALGVGDFSGDGALDVAVIQSDGEIEVFQNDTRGDFSPFGTPPNAGSSPTAIAVGDFNGDGHADLAITNGTQDNVSILLGDGTGNFTAAASPSTGSTPTAIAVGDFNSDGIDDLAVANSGDGSVTILLGKGDGTFTAQPALTTGNTPISLAVGTFNGNDTADIAVANQDPASTTGSTATILLSQLSQIATATATNISPAGTGTTHLVDASYAGDSIFAASVSSTTSLAGAGGTPQTITFTNPGTKIYGVAPITLTATASSGLAVSYTPNTPAVCSVSGSVATILNAGSCSITASQPGNSTYPAATLVEDTFSVNPAPLNAACGDAEAAQGAAIMLPAATLTGVVNGDAITASCSTAATTSSPAGAYPITPVFSDPQGRLPDYEVTLISGTLFIYSASGSAPLIFWLSANSANTGASGFTLNVYGAKFNSKAKVLWNGAVRATTDVSSTELQATILASDIAKEGTFLVTVANPAPNGAASSAQPFVAMSSTPVPTITGASISDAADGSGNHVLSLTGTDFLSGSTIEWKGTGLVTTYVSPWQIIATLPAADFGSAAVVTVVNPAPGGTSAGFDLP